MAANVTQLIGFNQINRDKWVTSIAQRLPPGTRVRDAGSGECRYRELFAHCEYKMQDFCQYAGTQEGILTENSKYGRIEYMSDIKSIPVPDSSFDAVLRTEVLEYVPEPILAIREFSRVLKVGGSLFLSAPLGSGLHQQPIVLDAPNLLDPRKMIEYGFRYVGIGRGTVEA